MSRRRRIFIFVGVTFALVSLAYLGFGLLDAPQSSPPDESVSEPRESRLIQPTDGGSKLWPFTSRERSTAGRTLATNLLIEGPPVKVRTSLLDRTNLDYQELLEDEAEAGGEAYRIELEGNSIDWDSTHGSTRYVYVNASGGQWLTESYQLHDGEYLGSREHIRAYNDPGGEWTAIQAHQEYFDLFRLRHTVTGIEGPAENLEREFLDQPFVDSVTREYHGIPGGWNDGWLSVVDLAAIVPVHELLVALTAGSIVSGTSRRAVTDLVHNLVSWSYENRQGYILFGSLIGLQLAVRSAGIGLERMFPSISPQLFAGGLYPILAVGPVLLVVFFARNLNPLPAFGFAAVGIGAGFTLDMLGLGLEVVPVRLVLHRVGLLLSIGLLALGIARRATDEPSETIDAERVSLATVGAVVWFVGLALPLLDVV
ncbi:MAG: hypothetical protein V5A52_00355 [Halovenus sp.]